MTPPKDALDPGDDGSYPNVPRNPDGTVDRERFPHGLRRLRARDRLGNPMILDVTVRDADGHEIAPDEPA